MKKIKKVPIQIYFSLPLEKDPALNIMNLGESGRKDIAEKHDDYLTES
jgi:hypothetical protein